MRKERESVRRDGEKGREEGKVKTERERWQLPKRDSALILNILAILG